MNSNIFLTWRSENKESYSDSTLNRCLAYYKAMYSTLISTDHYSKSNPLLNIKKIKIKEQELAYLTNDQITSVLIEAENSRNSSVINVIKICLSTGSRWGEAESLTFRRLRNNSITFVDTKNKLSRTIPIDEQLYNILARLRDKNHKDSDRIFESCHAACREVFERAKIDLPEGQLIHVFRHTFSSVFLQNGGSILTLQKVLDHKDLKTTLRYAHFAPDHMKEVLKFNPLSSLC